MHGHLKLPIAGTFSVLHHITLLLFASQSLLPAGVPSSVCNDGSSGRPFVAFK